MCIILRHVLLFLYEHKRVRVELEQERAVFLKGDGFIPVEISENAPDKVRCLVPPAGQGIKVNHMVAGLVTMGILADQPGYVIALPRQGSGRLEREQRIQFREELIPASQQLYQVFREISPLLARMGITVRFERFAPGAFGVPAPEKAGGRVEKIPVVPAPGTVYHAVHYVRLYIGSQKGPEQVGGAEGIPLGERGITRRSAMIGNDGRLQEKVIE